MTRSSGGGFLVLALLSLALAAAACGPDPAPVEEPPADPQVVAVYRGGRVTAADVDRAVLELPVPLRQPGPEETAAAWYEGLVRELVIDRLLLAEAEAAGAGDGPEIAAARRESRRQAVVETWLARQLPAAEEVTEEDARRYYDQHPERYDRAGRRQVSHLFKRRPADGDLTALKAEMAALRERAVAGESFATLAAEHSDSESRHSGGSLGWVTREGLAPQLAEVIFSLPEEVPSEPLTTAQGVHLFQVDQIVEARRFTFDEVSGMIGNQLRIERRRQAVERLATGLTLPAGSFVAEPEELAALLAAGDPQALVLQAGDYRLTVARFRALLDQSREQQGSERPPAELAPQLLAALGQRERIYHQAAAAGLADDPEVVARLERLDRRALLRTLRQRRLQRRLSDEPERLQQYYDDNRLRFAGPLRLEVRRLTVPVTAATADRTMARLERLSAEPGAGGERLSAVAGSLGGEVEELGWQTLGELARLNPRWASRAAGLETGQLSPPLSGPASLELLEVTGRREPEPLPFATVLERVKAAYLAAHLQEVYREWADATLGQAGLEVFRDRLQGLAGEPAAAGAPPA